ncbi:DUF6609 family protein [Neokomagataea anthophila]|uniref:Uncharacterized protein n=1 Tax=Neokomagataea anthophila TaxID=2826925 RepID=A0ABS5E9Z1_9PROT|nr:DUF6609 family protein [Neokomagataea anthophila]MBR0560724.1 hypothetical protein [Neokomagataea anthophila]
MFERFYNVHRYQAVPAGGPFITIMGLCIMLGAFMHSAQGLLVDIGFVLGGSTFMISWKLADKLPSLTKVQIISIVTAIAVEIVVFYESWPLLQTLNDQKTVSSILAIVAVHFVIMFPAYGLSSVLLTILCGSNALIGWFYYGYNADGVLFGDGVIKFIAGISMVLSSPIFRTNR